MTKCLTCGGVFSPVQADGMFYFHACPPVFDEGRKRYVERANARDENVDPAKARARLEGAKVEDVSKAAGLGAFEVPDAELIV